MGRLLGCGACALLAVLLHAAGCGGCYAVAWENGLSMTLRDRLDRRFPDGDYLVTVITDGLEVEALVRVGDGGPSCTYPCMFTATDGRRTLSLVVRGTPEALSARAALGRPSDSSEQPAVVVVELRRADALLGRHTLQPVYVVREPAGDGCGLQRAASAELLVDAAP